ELFAKLRAGRVEAVPRAEEILAPGAVAPQAAAPGRAESRPPGAGEVPVSDHDEMLLQQRDAMVEEVQAQLVRKLKRALQDEQNDLLDRLRGLRQHPTIDTLLPTAGEQADRYRAAALPFLGDVAMAAARF